MRREGQFGFRVTSMAFTKDHRSNEKIETVQAVLESMFEVCKVQQSKSREQKIESRRGTGRKLSLQL